MDFKSPWCLVSNPGPMSCAHGSMSSCIQTRGVLALYAAFLYVVVGWFVGVIT